MMLGKLSRLAIVTLACLGTTGYADDWPKFRGPDGSSVAENPKLPVEWSEEHNVAWRKAIPGRAWSCPIVCDGRVFVTTAIPDTDQEPAKKGLYFGGNRPEPRDTVYQWRVLCLDANSGDLLWEKTAHKGKPATAIHLKNTYASETPITDGEHVFVQFGAVGVYCYRCDNGDLIWEKKIGPYETRFGWGTSSSPELDDKHLYLLYDNEGQSFVTALDKKNGDEVWRKDRDEGSSWGSPFLWKTEERTELVTCGTNRVRSYVPETGELLWELQGMSSIVCPTPVAAHGLLYISSGYVGDKTRPLFAIRPGAEGDISLQADEHSNESVVWVQRQGGPYNPSPIVYGDLLYVLYDRGLMSCFDPKTGELVYEQKRVSRRAGFTASPWAYRDRIFCLNEDGDTIVIQPGKEFKVLGKNSLNEMCMSTPAIAGDSLFIRTLGHLYCIRQP